MKSGGGASHAAKPATSEHVAIGSGHYASTHSAVESGKPLFPIAQIVALLGLTSGPPLSPAPDGASRSASEIAAE